MMCHNIPPSVSPLSGKRTPTAPHLPNSTVIRIINRISFLYPFFGQSTISTSHRRFWSQFAKGVPIIQPRCGSFFLDHTSTLRPDLRALPYVAADENRVSHRSVRFSTTSRCVSGPLTALPGPVNLLSCFTINNAPFVEDLSSYSM